MSSATPTSAAGLMAVAVIRNRKTSEANDQGRVAAWNKTYEPAGRYDAAMNAIDLLKVEAGSR